METFGQIGGGLQKIEHGYMGRENHGSYQYNGTQTTASAPPPNTNAGAIPSLLNDQIECLKVLHQTIGELENRLAAVLGPTEGYPQPGGGTENPSQAIPARIEFSNDMIRAGSNRLRVLLSGLQL